jgi:hypothetical protein
MSDTQDQAHKKNIVAAEGARQTAIKSAAGNQASVVAADLAFFRALVVSAQANGLDTPRQSIHDLIGLWA